MMKPITVWERYNKEKNIWCHNHIEDGHIINDKNKPIGTASQTKIWDKSEWRYEHKYLDDDFRII